MAGGRQTAKPHILMVVPDPAVHGGIASVTAGYYGSRLEQDYRITYVQSYCDGSKWDKLRKALAAYRQFRRILRRDAPQLVHIHSSFGPSFYRKMPFILMASRRGIPVVNHIHGSDMEELYHGAPDWKKSLVRRIYGKCERIVVLADIWRGEFSRLASPERIVVIPNYARAYPEALQPSLLHVRHAHRGLLFLGVITEGKGVCCFPAIMEQVLEEFPDAVLTVAGSGDTKTLFADADPAVMAHIRFTGWVTGEEKEQLLRDNAVFLLPSHMECFSMSILEAMGHAMPVISCRVGSIPEAVEEGKTGFLFDVDDADGMAQAILSLLRDEALWTDMARAGVQRVEESYTLERHLQRIEAVYEEVLQGTSGSKSSAR